MARPTKVAGAQTDRVDASAKPVEELLAKERQKKGKEKIPDPKQKGQSRDKAAAALYPLASLPVVTDNRKHHK
jgi:hypothetical protein